MGVGCFTCFLAVVVVAAAVVLRCSASPEPNTDEFFVSDFLWKMGMNVVSWPSSVCSWEGVYCDEGNDKVIALVASGCGLSGPVPENTIGKLSKLRTLDLSDNNITGLSSDFWQLGSSLESLNVSSNQINGSLPNNLTNFEKLESLDLSCNEFSGEIPTSLGSLSSLKVLNFSGNGFEGSIPDSILGCQSLVSIDLSGNRLNGIVPGGLNDAFKNLMFLDLSGNEINGRPPELSGLKSITYLNLSGNLFEGSVLGVFQEPLQVIDLSYNRFRGHISHVNLSSSYTRTSLVYLDLSGNDLRGEFFGVLGRARSLKHLNLAFNRFSQQNFPQLEQLSGLEYLNLSKTSLTGQIPAEFSKLLSLKTLDLSQNHITGYIPDLSVDNLQVLDLSMNNLTGGIPEPLLRKLPSMIRFDFSYNHLKICAAEISSQIFNTAFVGSDNYCPLAVKKGVIRSNGTKRRRLALALAISLSLLFLIAASVFLASRFRKRTRSQAVKQLPSKEEPNVSGPFSFQTDSTTWVADVKNATSVAVVIFDKPLLNFSFADLLTATSHFDRATLLSEGKFGPVYRGILPGGIHVAIKVLAHGSSVTDQEAAGELERVGQIRHPNLVPLTGYCLAGHQRIVLYDYMENGSLQKLLHDLPLGVQTTEDWSTDTWEEGACMVRNITTEGMTTWRFRHKIALGAARALAFLHHGCYPEIVHRGVKASSIYLDSALKPRLSDFGLLKIAGASLEDEISRRSSGYAPPELSESENVSATTKSDVYAFGVVLFELITGKKALGEDYPEDGKTTLVGWARTLVKKNQAWRIIDPKIREAGLEKQMEEALRIAYLCTADLPSKRPCMQQIIGLLKDIEPIAADH